MILSDSEIRRRLEEGSLSVDPLNLDVQIQPASIDLRLGDEFLSPCGAVIDLNEKVHYVKSLSEFYLLKSKDFVLATTLERVRMSSDLTAFVEGRSSIGRLGLFVQNAGWVDPGFEGSITLELFNASNNPIILKRGIRIAQLVFASLEGECLRPYCGKYQHQTGTTESRLFMDKEFE